MQQQQISRRQLLKHLAIVLAAPTVIASCAGGGSEESEEATIAALANAIIPSDVTPGAGSVNAHRFVAIMIQDCHEDEDIKKFRSGLGDFRKRVNKQHGKAFSSWTQEEQHALLTELENLKEDSDLAFFYRTAKDLTIQAYLGSEYYLTKIDRYEISPGRFNGCQTYTA